MCALRFDFTLKEKSEKGYGCIDLAEENGKTGFCKEWLSLDTPKAYTRKHENGRAFSLRASSEYLSIRATSQE